MADDATQTMKTGVSYLRVSTKEQAEKGGQVEGFSIPAQREANRRKAESLGAVIIEEFVDAGESAKSADRPDLKRMLAYLTVNPVDYVLVHKVDRLARNRVDDVGITMAITKAGAKLVSATENIDETPSGMLLHGIMSSIAEFYSRNLATEVHKGMSQKAMSGGTPGRAPLGYINVSERTSDGREVRTVIVDRERGELISWAFTAFATDEWTLRSMTNELEARGLTTRRTPKLPSRAIGPNGLHGILTNPYYKGEVTYQGVLYPGHHTPLIDSITWQKVQDVLASHAAGEKQREHNHYLKSSVFCGSCGSRLIITNAKNPSGTIYPYFVCLGRHQKRTSCTRKAMLVTKLEELVEDYWATVRLAPELRDAIEAGLKLEIAAHRKEAEDEQRHLAAEKIKLNNQRKKLLDAIYTGAVPMDLIAGEQQRITDQLTAIEARLNAAATTLNVINANLARALDLARDCYAAYVEAEPRLRRLFNQAFFTHLYIDEASIQGEYAEPFATLLADNVLDVGRVIEEKNGQGAPSMAEVLDNIADNEANANTPGALGATGGFGGNLPPLLQGVEV
nr:hypothetical protein GCM10025730_38340 [Promicromonospora thailandica]